MKAFVYDAERKEYSTHRVVRKGSKKKGGYRYSLSKSKEFIDPKLFENKTRLSKFDFCITVARINGELKPILPTLNYYDEDGKLQPYYEPMNTKLEQHIFHSMKEDMAKYTLQTPFDQWQPFFQMTLMLLASIFAVYMVLPN